MWKVDEMRRLPKILARAWTRRSSLEEQDFPGRISRKLSLAVGTLFLLVFLVGGVSVFAARSIYQAAQEIGYENYHVQIMEDIHATVHHLNFEVARAASAGRAGRWDRIQRLARNLDRQLDAFGTLHETRDTASATSHDERAFYQEMQQTLLPSVSLIQKIVRKSARSGRVDPRDLRSLNRMTEMTLVQAERMRGIHQARVNQVVRMSAARMQFILWVYLTFVALGSGLIGVGWLIFSRTISLPMKRLISAALDISQGNLRRRVAVTSRDEIGQLSHSFNVMAEKLERREEELRGVQEELDRRVRETQALYRIGMEISTLSDLDGTLCSVVAKARELLNGEVACLCLVGVDGRFPRAISDPPDALSLLQRLPACLLREGGCRGCSTDQEGHGLAHVIAPLKRGGRSLGNLCVASRSLQAFSQQEAELLSNLANQVAIAIENARLYEQVQTSATLDERERIAREMHDSLAQTLGVLHLKVSRAQQLLGSDQPSGVEAALEEIRSLTESAYDDVRQAIYGLRTLVSRRLGLVPTLTEYLHEWSVQSGIAVDLQIHSEEATRLPPEAEVQLIRVIQEALTNVRKHAGAEHARVSFDLEEGLAVVTIADDGRGFMLAELQKQGRKGFGLETMRERAESVGGSLEITSQLGRGTKVIARLPLQGGKEALRWSP